MTNKIRKQIFISYAREDGSALAEKLAESLKGGEYEVFIDTRSIQGGDIWLRRIEKAILDSTHFIFVLTPKSVVSEWCEEEWHVARRNNIKIIPVLYRECEFPGFLGNRQYTDFRDEAVFSHSLRTLFRAIETESAPELHSLDEKWRSLPVFRYAVHKDKSDEVYCVSPTTFLHDAHAIIANTIPPYRFRHLLVTEDGQIGSRLLGILNLRQILKLENHPRRKTLTVKDGMDVYDPTPKVDPTFVWLHEKATVQEALVAFSMKLTKAPAADHFFYMSSIPLVDSANNAVGIVSFKDILKAMTDLKDIPIPSGTVRQYMRPFAAISVSLSDDTASFAKVELRKTGQRDVPVINNMNERRLLGLVPDHVFVRHYFNDRDVKMGKIMTPISHLKLQMLDTNLSEMLKQYMPDDVSKIYYSFAVVSARDADDPPRLEGLIGYREIFKAVLES